MTNSKATETSAKKSTSSEGSWGSHSGITCKHCGTRFYHGNVCGCAESKKEAYPDWTPPTFAGYGTLCF